MSRITRSLIVGVIAVLAIPALAQAKPLQRGFGQTYPYASKLCDKVANGHAPGKLAAVTDQVRGACDTLRLSFTTAQNTYADTVTPINKQATDAIALLRTTCLQAKANHTPAVCRAARQSTRATLASLRPQLRAAVQAYHGAVDAARKAFWSTIHTLRGGANVTGDTHIPPLQTPTLPSDTSVPSA